MLPLLIGLLVGLVVGLILGLLATLRWLRTETPRDLTIAYLMGWEDRQKTQTGIKPSVKGVEELMRRQKGE